MPRYRYSGTNLTGEPVTGEREAPDPDALVNSLAGELLLVGSVQEIRPDRDTHSGPSKVGRIGPREAVDISSHLSEIMNAKLPLGPGLAALAAECHSWRMARALRGLSRDLEAGDDLETALAHRRAPEELKAVVRAGARSGDTGRILEHYVLNTQSTSDMRQAVRRGLFYPLLLVVGFVGVTFAVLAWIVPRFSAIFLEFDVKIPLPTAVLLNASQLIREWGGAWLAGSVGLVLLVGFVFRISLGKVGFRRLVCRIPLFGPILRWTAMARFSQLLSLLIENSVPLNEALPLAGKGARDPEIEHDCRAVAAEVARGETLEVAARRLHRFPVSFAQALSWDQSASGLPDVLQSLGDMYAGRVRMAISLILAIFPTLLLIAVGGGIGFLVVAMFLPLIELLNQLS
ncbi:MAG: type II secretion system F family protein [Planctomycetales bacterium]